MKLFKNQHIKKYICCVFVLSLVIIVWGLIITTHSQHQPVRYLINYGDNCCTLSKAYNCYMGWRHGMDHCFSFGRSVIDDHFLKENYDILSLKRGSGYWLWKPYVIFHALTQLTQPGDVVFYMDAGSYIKEDIDPLIHYFLRNENQTKGIMSFSLGWKESMFTKRDAAILMGADQPQYMNTSQRLSSFVLMRNTPYVKDFVQEWLNYAKDRRIITDIPSTLGIDYDDFIDNRHDQSIFSLLCKLKGIPAQIDPSQFGEGERNRLLESGQPIPYPQVIQHTRWRKLFQKD